jgi:hypothetical protein
VIISPFAAAAVSAMGFRFPFPRIFDRTVMVTLLGAMLIWSHAMGFTGLIREGFAAPRANWWRALIGLAIAVTAIAILFGLAFATGAGANVSFWRAPVFGPVRRMTALPALDIDMNQCFGRLRMRLCVM